jgi:hypothetical protein
VFWLLLVSAPMLGTEAVLAYFWIVVLNVSGVVRQRTRWMAALPMSHRGRLMWIVVPAVAVSVGCVALGTAIRPWMPFQPWSLTRDGPLPLNDGYRNRTSVSIDHWRRGSRGTAPVISAPWGEEVVADTAIVFGVTLYNPFTTVESNTPRFREWQFERATTEVYGEPVALEAYERGYTPPHHIVGGVRTALATGAVLLIFGLAILFVSELGYSHRRRPGSRTTLIVQWGAALLVMGFMAADVAYRVRGGDVVLVLVRRGLVELGARLPSNVMLAVVMAALPVAAAYALLEWQFRRSEPGLVVDRQPG